MKRGRRCIFCKRVFKNKVGLRVHQTACDKMRDKDRELLGIQKRSPSVVRSKVSDLVGDAVASPLNSHQDSVKELLESLHDASENISEAARQIADRLGLEM